MSVVNHAFNNHLLKARENGVSSKSPTPHLWLWKDFLTFLTTFAAIDSKMSGSSYSNMSEACSSRTSDDAIVSEKDKEAGSHFQSYRTIDHIFGREPDLPSIQEHMIVEFDGLDDPSRSMNWKMSKKVYACMLYGLLNCGATWATSR